MVASTTIFQMVSIGFDTFFQQQYVHYSHHLRGLEYVNKILSHEATIFGLKMMEGTKTNSGKTFIISKHHWAIGLKTSTSLPHLLRITRYF